MKKTTRGRSRMNSDACRISVATFVIVATVLAGSGGGIILSDGVNSFASDAAQIPDAELVAATTVVVTDDTYWDDAIPSAVLIAQEKGYDGFKVSVSHVETKKPVKKAVKKAASVAGQVVTAETASTTSCAAVEPDPFANLDAQKNAIMKAKEKEAEDAKARAIEYAARKAAEEERSKAIGLPAEEQGDESAPYSDTDEEESEEETSVSENSVGLEVM